jgi:hypothetical protein
VTVPPHAPCATAGMPKAWIALAVLLGVAIQLAGCATPAPQPAPPAPAQTTSTPPTSTAPIPNLTAVAAIVTAAGQHYRALFAAGQAFYNTPGFAPWYRALGADKTCEPSWAAASAMLPDNEGPALGAWFQDCVEASSHINQWGAAALLAEPGPASTAMAQQASTVSGYLELLNKDVVVITLP